MATRCSSSSLPWLLLLVALGDAVAATAVPRRLLGIAEQPTAAPGTAAAGPAGALRAGGGGRHDRSVVGAEAILAGFAAAVIVTIFCYIRVTRKNSSSNNRISDVGVEVGVGVGAGGKQQGC